MEGQMACATKMCAGYMRRYSRNATKRHQSYAWNITKNLILEFIKILSTPWHGAVDQDWRS